MIYGTKRIGKELLDFELVNKFRYMYLNLRKNNSLKMVLNLLINTLFLMNSLRLQFDGLFALYINLINSKPDQVKKIDGLKEFIETKCGPLAVISNLIIFMLNNYILDDEVVSILENPYDHVIDKNSIKDHLKLKKNIQGTFKNQ